MKAMEAKPVRAAKAQKPMTMAEYNGSAMDRAADQKALAAINAMRKTGDSTPAKERAASDKAHMATAKGRGR